MENHFIEWEGHKIDLNDYRLHDYILFVDTFGNFNIMHKQNFSVIKLTSVDKDEFVIRDSKNNNIGRFTDFEFFLINC